MRLLGFLQLQLSKPALVIDGHGGTVHDGLLDVIDADIVAEDRAGVLISQLDGSAGKADEGGMGQGVAHVASVAVNKVVLAAVRLVGDDDDVAPVGQERVPVAFLFGEEFLDGGEYHAPGCDIQLVAQVSPVFGLHRRLAQQFGAAGKGAKELVVKVVAVGQDDQCRVGHGRFADDTAGKEGHGQALAGALCVPDDADTPVAGVAAMAPPGFVTPRFLGAMVCGGAGTHCLAHGAVDGVVLVIAGHLFDEGAIAGILED